MEKRKVHWLLGIEEQEKQNVRVLVIQLLVDSENIMPWIINSFKIHVEKDDRDVAF